ncbi:DUF4412 domain-containing protein [Flavobacteriaceae bacterium R38]|nr:DUF4412 domain-containing protein [Flavobacteriaceae bacterium R38]
MKTKVFYFVILLSLVHVTSNAQVFKKLAKKVEKGAKHAIETKVYHKARRTTNRAFDSLFNNNGQMVKGKKSALPKAYIFSHKYVLEIDDGRHITPVTYLLNENQAYIGILDEYENEQQIISVIDVPNDRAHTFLKLERSKQVTSLKIDLKKETKKVARNEETTVEATGNTKDILGYTCHEYKITNRYTNGFVWIADDTEVTFPREFHTIKPKKGPDQSWAVHMDGLIMEMDISYYTDKKKKQVKMVCTKLIPDSFILDVSQYRR